MKPKETQQAGGGAREPGEWEGLPVNPCQARLGARCAWCPDRPSPSEEILRREDEELQQAETREKLFAHPWQVAGALRCSGENSD